MVGRTLSIVTVVALALGGCNKTAAIPTKDDTQAALEQCKMAEGVVVESIEIDAEGPVDITEGEVRNLPIVVNYTAPKGAPLSTMCLALRDAGVIPNPIALSFTLLQGRGSRARTPNALKLTCEGGEVKGLTGVGELLNDFDRSSGEKRTRVYVQHVEDGRYLANRTVGISGVNSDRIRVRCI